MQELLDQSELKMEEALEFLHKELATIVTGRANPALLDNVKVESYGSFMPINQLSNISAPDASTITLQVWDKEMVKPIEKSIMNSDLGLNPMSDGQLIRISIPKLSEERRLDLAKLAKKYGENKKVQIRNIRRDFIDKFKKENQESGSKDNIHGFTEILQKITDDYVAKIDNAVIEKEKDLTTI
ncbi:ribosome recycling factor [Rickettsiales bacterium]|nr:ribosome recycling factor [Rickettsiales bacterium]MDB2550502.1 ribosome recycling factor [Rickettsiales bacterium]